MVLPAQCCFVLGCGGGDSETKNKNIGGCLSSLSFQERVARRPGEFAEVYDKIITLYFFVTKKVTKKFWGRQDSPY